jgi:single-stranded-DNA-specific exonuclease
MPGLDDSRRWDVLGSDPDAEKRLVRELDVSPLVARVLVARGLSDAKRAYEFLTPSLERDWADPSEVPGLSGAADRVEAAIRSGEDIAIFGDFDVDGMSSTCLLTRGLRQLGGKVRPYIPHRFGEGYGLSRAALDRVLLDGKPDLIVTVDNGIASGEETARLRDYGVDVVVTDNHEPAELVPADIPVADPKLAESGPSHELAGVGVALKLLCELCRRFGQPDLWRDYTDLAALGTLSDMMTLSAENRAIVTDGIALMRRGRRPGLVALAAVANQDISEIAADTLPFSIIPRLNAAGRMGTTEVAFDLLMTDDPADAAQLAGQLEAINTERRQIESKLTDEAVEKVERTWSGGRIIVVGGEGWHEGVKGIVASRLVNRYHVPAILFTISDGVARGSGRSVGSVDLFHAVEQCSDMLIRFGGHPGAVGVTCEADRLDEFRERMEKVLDELPDEQFETRGEVTATVRLGELNVATIGSLEALQPFGQGNKKPLFAARAVTMKNRARVGADGSHLRFIATDGVSSVPAIMFRVPECARACATDAVVDLVFEAVDETWQGRTKAKLMVKDIIYRDDAPAAGPAFVDGLFQRAAGAPASATRARDDSRADAQVPSRQTLASLSEEELTDGLVRALIGDHSLLPAQRASLDLLSQGRSCLCVMATGRGKSLIFHVHAARAAILRHQASVFVYPLRALVSDQAHHLADELSPLGLGVEVLTGETSSSERRRIFRALAGGSADVILTTPEFLAIHAKDFAASGRVGFLVIDEAHHASPKSPGAREAYSTLPAIRALLGEPSVLAVTATASTEVARDVCALCGISETDVIVDGTVRDNLMVDDQRGIRDQDDALASIVAAGGKTLVYANSRKRTVDLARMLRHQVPERGQRIAFYNAGLPRADRVRVERAFRDGELDCIVATSAFGEGVNVPDVRNVVLFDMPLGRVEFNQMSGRAGRDGKPAFVRMLFGSRGFAAGERVLSMSAPDRDELVTIYRTLRSLSVSGGIVATDEQIAIAADATGRVPAGAVSCGIGVFSELGFLNVEGYGASRQIMMVSSPAHADLADSARYLEGIRQRQAYNEFGEWVLSCTEGQLLSAINRPITPSFGTRVDMR